MSNPRLASASSHEDIALLVITSGCGAAIILTGLILICCRIFVRKNRHHSHRTVVFDRQTTTSEEANGELFSCGYEESTSAPQDNCDISDDQQSGSGPGSPEETETSQHDLKFNTRPVLEPRMPLKPTPERLIITAKRSPENTEATPLDEAQETKVGPLQLDASDQNKASGIQRQQRFDNTDEELVKPGSLHKITISSLINKQAKYGSQDSEDGPSPETVRKQYKELWQLRATYQAEEEKEMEAKGTEGTQSADLPVDLELPDLNVRQHPREDGKLEKHDSGYKSMDDRRDYSIDFKSETIYRQFTGGDMFVRNPNQSIEEEDESESSNQRVNQHPHQPVYV
ncbi:hypothetical protein HDE_08094 [Halotydeus destructor]|nr:hypothetical protein HDE_08094 [Halotydeus destructor]